MEAFLTQTAIARQRISKMREALTWIAGQGCNGDTGDYERCRNLPNNPCITEYCLPCFASEALEQDDKDAEWERHRAGLGENQP